MCEIHIGVWATYEDFLGLTMTHSSPDPPLWLLEMHGTLNPHLALPSVHWMRGPWQQEMAFPIYSFMCLFNKDLLSTGC